MKQATASSVPSSVFYVAVFLHCNYIAAAASDTKEKQINHTDTKEKLPERRNEKCVNGKYCKLMETDSFRICTLRKKLIEIIDRMDDSTV